jgi:hypothetical protein
MLRRAFLSVAVVTGVAAAPSVFIQPAPGAEPAAVLCPKRAGFLESLAAKEIRRYVYLRTGKLVPIVNDIASAPDGALVAVGMCYPRFWGFGLNDCPELQKAPEGPWADGQYVLKTVQHEGRPIVVVGGTGSQGALYGAYRFAEHLGVRFYMHGDVVPDRQEAIDLPQLDEVGKPLFDRRGIQPFHDFPEGPDWWDTDEYKAIIGQLPKMGMNFFGLHTYPEGGVGPEPLTWIGLPDVVSPDGTVKASYPSRHFTTANPTGAWGYRPMKTGDYAFGAAALYDCDDFAPGYMRIEGLWNQMSPEECNALFDRMGRLLAETFTFARRLGVKTCIGTETPLTIPTPVKERLKAAGKDPADPAVIQEVYEGMFQRIMKTHPLDYYWFWTPEGWTWSGTKQEQIDATLGDLRAAIAAAEKVKAPFTLATCGWVLGPAQDRALFDKMLPKAMPMSCINRQVGHSPVEPGFADVEGRPKWAIPWMEDDPTLNSPQLWAGRMRKDAADALAYGCTGLMGIHWRTRILGPNVSALAKAAWDQSAFNPAVNPGLKVTLPKPPEGPDGGQYAHFPNNPIEDTEEDPVYQDVRYDVSAYYLDVPNGTYTVTLKLCEPHYTEAGRRVFGAIVQGKQVFDKLDLFAKVGQNRALDYTVKNVEVSDGRLVIDFVHQTEFPCVAGIVVEGPATRKINCGGPAWRDYQADWPPSEKSNRDRFLPVTDFYADWARSQFGPEAADGIAAVFDEIDGFLPRPSNWVGGPGGINPDPRPWDEVKKDYAFVDELAALRPRVQGPGNLERFDFWLNQFRYMRANAQVNCTWARFNAAMTKVKAEKDAEAQKRLARELALPIRRELVAQVADVYRHLLATVTTTGLMGNVTNWQQHITPFLLTGPGEELAKILGEPLPADCQPSKDYQGEPRLFVPTVRTCLVEGEPLRLTAVVLGPTPSGVAVHWRTMGTGDFARVPMEHAARGVYRVTLSGDATAADLEYYVQAEMSGAAGPTGLSFPATAPKLNQTVVVVPTGG